MPLEMFLHDSEDVVVRTFTVTQPNFTELQFYRAVGNELGLNFAGYWRDRWEVRRKLGNKIVGDSMCVEDIG